MRRVHFLKNHHQKKKGKKSLKTHHNHEPRLPRNRTHIRTLHFQETAPPLLPQKLVKKSWEDKHETTKNKMHHTWREKPGYTQVQQRFNELSLSLSLDHSLNLPVIPFCTKTKTRTNAFSSCVHKMRTMQQRSIKKQSKQAAPRTWFEWLEFIEGRYNKRRNNMSWCPSIVL